MERFEYIRSLYRRHLAHALTAREQSELMLFFDTCSEEELQHVVGRLSDETDAMVAVTADQEHRVDVIFGRIAAVTRPKPHKPLVRRLAPWLAAAMVILVSGVALLFFFASETGSELVDVQPGGNRATLTLADGRVVNLDEAQTGIIIGAEDITYQDGISLGVPLVESLTLTTPKGGTYQVTLPDGSRVWLNANSTLKYPFRFSGDLREVILEGEAYFEIVSMDRTRKAIAGERADYGSRAVDLHVPFKVTTTGQVVEVLGTQFNISAYGDDPETKTTLVEGKVRLGLPFGKGRSFELKPGEQGVTHDSVTIIAQVDINQFTAWREGYFHFGESLEQIMEQLARWYDVTVVYADGVDRRQEFGGRISRDKPISAALRIMAMTDKVNFKLEVTAAGERRVLVMP